MTWMPHTVDADREYDDMRIRIDEGLECPKCHGDQISRRTYLNIPQFHCDRCGTPWFDLTAEAA